MDKRILFVGCGKMGGALLGGLLKNNYNKNNILIIEPNTNAAKEFGVDVVTDASMAAYFKAEIVIFAVKPQIIESVLADFKKDNYKDSIFVSIAAGKTIEFFENNLSSSNKIIRAMPNLPALAGQGVTVFKRNDNIKRGDESLIGDIFKTVGDVYWIDDENMLDAVTAISGSGPAYVFHFMECLIKSGANLGLPTDLAKMLACSTVVGSAILAIESEKTVTELKNQVVSPGGTTEAGLKVLEKDGEFGEIIDNTAKAACQRSKELSN